MRKRERGGIPLRHKIVAGHRREPSVLGHYTKMYELLR